jgi:hypothetical protein
MGVPFDFAQGTPFIDFIVFLSEPYWEPIEQPTKFAHS